MADRKRIKSSKPYKGKSRFGEMLDGIKAQGIDHEDAVETLRVGLRQANGRPEGARQGPGSRSSDEQVA